MNWKKVLSQNASFEASDRSSLGGIAEMRIEDILTDHAYCEQKAASSCISLILRFNDLDQIVIP